MIYGLDVSRWQGSTFDFHKARREGYEFAIIRSWARHLNAPDPEFARNLRVARDAGMIVAAYHFITPWESGAVNTDHVLRTVPADCPVILDIELDGKTGQGTTLGLATDVTNRLRHAGRHLPLVYLPHWYWDGHLGQPDITHLAPGLWSSRYVNNMGGTGASIYRHVSPSWWHGYGGLPTEILQYTDETTIAGQTPVDANAYRGTRAELQALLEGDDMFTDEDRRKLDQAVQQMTGSFEPWKFPGFPTKLDDGNKFSFVDFLRWTDHDMYKLRGAEAGQSAAINGLIDALGSSTFDREAYLEQVRQGVREALADYSREVHVSVSEATDGEA